MQPAFVLLHLWPNSSFRDTFAKFAFFITWNYSSDFRATKAVSLHPIHPVETSQICVAFCDVRLLNRLTTCENSTLHLGPRTHDIHNTKWWFNPLSIDPFLDTSLKMDIPKIKWLLFLNPFDYSHNPGLFWKVVTLWGLLSTSQNYSKYYWNKVREAHSESGSFFFSLKRFSVFDWIQIIVAVAGALRNTLDPSHWTNPLSYFRTISPKISIVHCSF